MAIDYLAQSETYRPTVIKTLLVGEAPPASGATYFYLPAVLRGRRSIRENSSLPATIFHHYFGNLPDGTEEYAELLLRLKEQGIFLVDLLDSPIKVRGSPEGLRQVIEAIPILRAKLARRNIEVADENMVFLLARNSYRAKIRQEFPRSQLVRWVDFRTTRADA
jgi:hypothetical protein